MTDLIEQIKEYRLVLTVWNKYGNRLELVTSTNRKTKNSSENSEEHETEFRAGYDGLIAAIGLLESLLEQLKDIKENIPKN